MGIVAGAPGIIYTRRAPLEPPWTSAHPGHGNFGGDLSLRVALHLWRMHQVHHSDPDSDLSTGARVHPLDTVLVQGATLAAVALLGPPVAAGLVVEVVTCFQVCFGHANVATPAGFENYLWRCGHSADASRSPFGRCQR